jgi:ABC-type glycerol-3-phosphate transport system substrate-binding protein
MKKIRPFTCFLFAVTVLFLVFSPAIIREGLGSGASAGKEKSFKGILTLWQINGWQGGGQPVSLCIKKCIRDFENRNVYVFIDTVVLTPAKAAEKLAAGETPDLLSFPAGFLSDPSRLTPLDGAVLQNTPLKASALFDGKYYALPILMNPYMLYINEELLSEREVEVESLNKLSPELLFKTAETLSFEKKEGKKQKQIYGAALQGDFGGMPAGTLAFFAGNAAPRAPETASPSGSVSPQPSAGETAGAVLRQEAYNIKAATEDGLQLFLDRQAGLLIAPAGADAALKASKQTPPAYSRRPFSLYTDIAQYIGVFRTDDVLKTAICRKFVNSLYSAKNTPRLAQSGAMPAVYDETLFTDDAAMKEAYSALLQNGVFPNAFAWSALREKLKEEAPEAALGDGNALENIRRLLLNKLY